MFRVNCKSQRTKSINKFNTKRWTQNTDMGAPPYRADDLFVMHLLAAASGIHAATNEQTRQGIRSFSLRSEHQTPKPAPEPFPLQGS